MRKVLTAMTFCMMLLVGSSTTLTAEESNHKNKISIEEMEEKLAILGAEIAKEKVKLFQKEALLHEMELDLLRKKQERDNHK